MKEEQKMDAESCAELYRLREAVKGPEGFKTWQEAAVAERVRRVKAERATRVTVEQVQAANARMIEKGQLRRDLATVYALNAQGYNRWSAQVQPGQDDAGNRISDAECEAVAVQLIEGQAVDANKEALRKMLRVLQTTSWHEGKDDLFAIVEGALEQPSAFDGWPVAGHEDRVQDGVPSGLFGAVSTEDADVDPSVIVGDDPHHALPHATPLPLPGSGEVQSAGAPDNVVHPRRVAGKDDDFKTRVQPSAQTQAAQKDWVVQIAGIDEYGPRLEWQKHWAEVGVGAKLYAPQPSAAKREPLSFDDWLDQPDPTFPKYLRRECYSSRVMADFKIGWDAHAQAVGAI